MLIGQISRRKSPPLAGGGQGEGRQKGEGKPKTWGPPKMTKRTQFSPAPTAISDCVAYEWRPPAHFRTHSKVGFDLAFVPRAHPARAKSRRSHSFPCTAGRPRPPRKASYGIKNPLCPAPRGGPGTEYHLRNPSPRGRGVWGDGSPTRLAYSRPF